MFTDPSFGRPMPIRDAMYPVESGNGYALRMVVENGMAYSDLTNSLVSLGHRYLPHSAARAIAFWFGGDPVAVVQAIPSSFRRDGHSVTSFMGHVFTRPYHIRFTRPQVCVRCLEELGFASAAWELSLVTACPRHHLVLVDQCAQCHRIISWRRPDLWTCHCGVAFFSAVPQKATAEEVWFSQRLEDLLFRRFVEYEGHDSVRRILAAFELDVLLRVVRAFGVSVGLHERDMVPGRLTRVLRSVDAHAVVCRAFSRLRSITEGINDEPSPAVHLKELCGLTREAVDREALMLMEILNKVVPNDANGGSPRAESTQLRLF